MAEAFVQPRDAASHRSACRLTRSYDPHKNTRSLRTILALGLMALMLAILSPPRVGLAASPGSEGLKTAPAAPLDFEACVRLALQQSPYLIKSSMEIDIRKMDEADSRYSMVPPLTFRSYYYLDHPTKAGFVSKPYSLSFSMDPYNPFVSYFTLQAQKIFTKMAILTHVKMISESLQRMGKLFLDLEVIKKLAAYQTDLCTLSRENLTYAENRQSIGTGTSLEVRVASQELEITKNEKDQLELTRKRLINNLKGFLGLDPAQEITLNLQEARRQVLGNFDPAGATLEQAKAKSLDLKILELRKELQEYNITLAKAKVFPTLLFNTTTPDPLSLVNASGFYVGFGLEVPVWDGLKRIRNVSRQKAILKQYGAEKEMKEVDFTDGWNTFRENLSSAAAALKIARSQEELARLKERQGEIRYHSGAEPLPTWLDARKANLEAQKNTLKKAQEYDEIILNMRTYSGDLGYSYVDPNSWQK